MSNGHLSDRIDAIEEQESLDELLNYYMKNMKKELPEERPRGLTCFRSPKPNMID